MCGIIIEHEFATFEIQLAHDKNNTPDLIKKYASHNVTHYFLKDTIICAHH